MRIFFYSSNATPQIVSFLKERGHELLYRKDNLESTLATIHVSEISVFDVSESDANLGIAFTCAVLREKKKCIVIYNQNSESKIPEFILGCTFKNVYIRPYKSVEEYMNILKLFLL